MADPLKTISPSDFDAYAPDQIAARVESAAVAKAKLPVMTTFVLAVLAGAFIAFGSIFFTVVTTQSGLGFGPTRLLGGVAFSLGLVLVVIAGAELFTGNNLIVMAWADRQISFAALMRNWSIVYCGNLVGAVATAAIVALSGTLNLADGAVADTAVAIAASKVSLGYTEAFFRGLLCNALVCLAIWLCFAAHDVSGKILAIVFPISAFVAAGFEHSVANMYLIPVAMMTAPDAITLTGFLHNLVPVTLGNIMGGSVFVALVYWVVYRRKAERGNQ